MKRIQPPARLEQHRKDVIMCIKALSRVHSKSGLGRIDFLKRSIQNNPHSQQYRTFCRIVDYLTKLRGKAGNPMEWLVEDYITSVYERFYKRAPHINQLSPGDANQLGFETWIINKEEDIHPDRYWIEGKVDLEQLSKKVKKQTAQMKRMKEVKRVPESLDINIIERK